MNDTKQKPGTPQFLQRRRFTIQKPHSWLVFLTLLAPAVYLIASRWTSGTGFPLDDAWIHQTFARNFASGAGWSFFAHELSTANTSPLWAGLISIGFFFRLNPLFWTFLLGWLSYIALVIWLVSTYERNSSKNPSSSYLLFFLIAVEWHLVWSSMSGMETILFSLLVTVILVSISSERNNFFLIGLLLGVSVWLRPDGLTLLPPAFLAIAIEERPIPKRIQSAMVLSCGFLLLFIPFILLNIFISGNPMPTTYYAKQSEYVILLKQPFMLRYLSLLKVPLIGVGVILAPGFIFHIGKNVLQRKWEKLPVILWWFGFIGLYAWRLPVTYQHGRYMIPILPLFFLWGFIGTSEWFENTRINSKLARVVNKVWQLALPPISIVFFFLGAQAYASDVSIIENDMVKPAKWVHSNLPTDTLIASHDIGALGYFSDRRILDLAGLISPEVIPFIRDENRLAGFLTINKVDYLIAFPDWYPKLTKNRFVVYSAPVNHLSLEEYAGMQIYRWSNSIEGQ